MRARARFVDAGQEIGGLRVGEVAVRRHPSELAHLGVIEAIPGPFLSDLCPESRQIAPSDPAFGALRFEELVVELQPTARKISTARTASETRTSAL